jgi:hypothetical protein
VSCVSTRPTHCDPPPPRAYAVVGCSILLVIWPTALYQLTENMAGVAIGLVVASAVLLVAVQLLSRCQ